MCNGANTATEIPEHSLRITKHSAGMVAMCRRASVCITCVSSSELHADDDDDDGAISQHKKPTYNGEGSRDAQ